jgi:hypothetical protein
MVFNQPQGTPHFSDLPNVNKTFEKKTLRITQANSLSHSTDMSSNVLADRDVNAAAQQHADVNAKSEVKSMEYHRQVLQSKLEESKYVHSITISLHSLGALNFNDARRGKQTYISPSDTIMSPCTAKLSAYRNKQVGK